METQIFQLLVSVLEKCQCSSLHFLFNIAYKSELLCNLVEIKSFHQKAISLSCLVNRKLFSDLNKKHGRSSDFLMCL